MLSRIKKCYIDRLDVSGSTNEKLALCDNQ